jgi:hypothetical protein
VSATLEAKKRFSVLRMQKDVRGILRALQYMLDDQCLKAVHDVVKEAKRHVEYLAARSDLRCEHCGIAVDFGYNCCAGCADERGP